MRLGCKYVKGYQFDHRKACQQFSCEPYTAEALQLLDIVVKNMNRDDYITMVAGYRVSDQEMRTEVIFMLDGGDDLEDLDKRPISLDNRPSITAAKSFLSGPFVYVLQN